MLTEAWKQMTHVINNDQIYCCIVKVGFYVNSKGHMGTGPQHLSLVGFEPTQR